MGPIFGVIHLTIGALAVATSVTATLSFTSAPLGLFVNATSIGSDQQHLKAVTVTVENRTGAPLSTHFMVNVGADHPMASGRPPGSPGRRRLRTGRSP